MKVLVSCRDSGSLAELTFARGTDTSVATSAKPEEKFVLAAKGDPAVRFVVTSFGIVVARQRGQISLYSSEYELVKDLGTAKDIVMLDVCDSTVYWCGKDGQGTSYDLKSDATASFKLPCDITVAVKHPSKPLVVCSGSQLRPEVHCLETQTTVFQARNPKADRIALEEQNLVTNAAWLADPAEGVAFATITSHGKVRTYATAASKKPAQNQIGTSSLSAVVVYDGKLVIGDSSAKIGLFQLQPFRLLGGYKGVVGGTTHLSIYNGLVCAVGLDRYVRLYEAGTRSPAGKVYVGQELLWAAVLQDDDEKRELEDDEMWQGMKSKKQRVSPSESKQSQSESEHSQDESESEHSQSEISEYSDSEFSE